MSGSVPGNAALTAGWCWAGLGDCVDVLDSRRIPVNSDEREKRVAGKPASELHPYYGATGRVGWIDGYLFDEELLLVGEDGAPFLDPFKPKAYIIRGKSWVNNHAHVLRALGGLTSHAFLCYYLNAFDYHGYVTGTTRHKLNQEPLRRVPVPLPPLPEQKRIAEKIEELFTRLEAGVEALKAAKRRLKAYRQAVLRDAFTGRLTAEWRERELKDPDSPLRKEPAAILLDRIRQEREKGGKKYKRTALPPLDTSRLPELPEGWCWARLAEVCETTSGGTPSRSVKKFFEGHIPWLKSGEMTDGLVTAAEEHITAEAVERSAAKVVPKGTLLMALYGATAGKMGILAIDAAINQAICAVVPPLGVRTPYVFWYLRSRRADLLQSRQGGAQPNLSQQIIATLPFPLPLTVEQDVVASEIERRFSLADAAEQTIERSLKQAERLRQSILKRAFEGKLVPQDPTDEPTEKLLERIKAERAALEGTAKKARSRGKREKTARPRAKVQPRLQDG